MKTLVDKIQKGRSPWWCCEESLTADDAAAVISHHKCLTQRPGGNWLHRTVKNCTELSAHPKRTEQIAKFARRNASEISDLWKWFSENVQQVRDQQPSSTLSQSTRRNRRWREDCWHHRPSANPCLSPVKCIHKVQQTLGWPIYTVLKITVDITV